MFERSLLRRQSQVDPKPTRSQPIGRLREPGNSMRGRYEAQADWAAQKISEDPEPDAASAVDSASEAPLADSLTALTAPQGESVQRSTDPGSPSAAASEQSGEITDRGSGQPLDRPLRRYMERRFGFNFAAVRVHHDSAAHKTAVDLHANALTIGADIYFRRGAYDPANRRGRVLLAHELSHFVQQQKGGLGGRAGLVQRQAVTSESLAAKQTPLAPGAAAKPAPQTLEQIVIPSAEELQKELDQIRAGLMQGQVQSKGPKPPPRDQVARALLEGVAVRTFLSQLYTVAQKPEYRLLAPDNVSQSAHFSDERYAKGADGKLDPAQKLQYTIRSSGPLSKGGLEQQLYDILTSRTTPESRLTAHLHSWMVGVTGLFMYIQFAKGKSDSDYDKLFATMDSVRRQRDAFIKSGTAAGMEQYAKEHPEATKKQKDAQESSLRKTQAAEFTKKYIAEQHAVDLKAEPYSRSDSPFNHVHPVVKQVLDITWKKVQADAKSNISFQVMNRDVGDQHSWGLFSVDLNLTDRALHRIDPDSSTGFWDPEKIATLIRYLHEAVNEVGSTGDKKKPRINIYYNDARASIAANTAAGNKLTVKPKMQGADNWHGPAPLILHLHVDIIPG